jgi:hypothetical protein
LPEYAELAAAAEGARPIAFYAENETGACLIPLLIRPIPTVLNAPADWFDCISPYGYSGILLSSPPEGLHSFLDAFCHAARARGIVTAFVRLHPLFLLDHGALGDYGQLIRHGKTVYINLSDSKGHIWQQVSTNHQRNIKRLVRSGFYCSLDDSDRFQEFIAIYHSTMQRVGARSSYYFSTHYFEALRAMLGTRVHLACVLGEANELAAAGLFLATEGIVTFHIGGTAAQYLSLAPSKLMIDFIWRWAQEELHDLFHLGGGVGGGEDSLFHFKAGFSPARGQFYTYRVVFDESKNATLNQAAQLVRGTDVAGSKDFFPKYRDPQ